MGNCWRIEFAERPLRIGILDNLLFGKDASHSFLRLIDENDNVTAELHGYSYDFEKKSLVGFSVPAVKHLKSMFNDAASKQDELKVFHFDGERTQDPRLKTKTIFTGNSQEAIERWMMARDKAVEINQAAYEYCPIRLMGVGTARNCHTVSATLMKAMRTSIPTPHYATPGLSGNFEAAANDTAIEPKRNENTSYTRSMQNALSRFSTMMLESHQGSIQQHAIA